MAQNTIELKSVYDLSGKSFHIGSYQRGYRWTETQVNDLLNDIKSFSDTLDMPNTSNAEFYCLQPIVVKNIEEDKWEVIDGQQRLTTLFLILKKLEEFTNNYPHFKRYSISYEKDINLEEIQKSDKDNNTSIDLFFLQKAYNIIDEYIDKLIAPMEFLKAILHTKINDKVIEVKNCRFIWYETESNKDNSIDIFTRINIGKIPLTDAELIKADLLKSSNFDNGNSDYLRLRKLQIASEWDNIEKYLENNSFWYFIYNTNTNNPKIYNNRIEYIFDLLAEENTVEHCTFLYFHDKLNGENKQSIDKIWNDVKNCFFTLEEWFNDNTLYHYIGYLVASDISIKDILAAAKNKTKTDFLEIIKTKIRESLGRNFDLDSMEYGKSSDLIRKTLLLFNIESIVQGDTNIRFPFDDYKTGSWDIEHIRSQTDKTLKNTSEKLGWLEDMIKYYEENTYPTKEIEEIKKKITEKAEHDTVFNNLFTKIQDEFKESDESDEFGDKDNIGNLTLLNSTINRSYGNAFFYIKRKRIIESDKEAKFIPLCTKNLFLKYYSDKIDNLMYWNKIDADAYKNAIEETLGKFIKKVENTND